MDTNRLAFPPHPRNVHDKNITCIKILYTAIREGFALISRVIVIYPDQVLSARARIWPVEARARDPDVTLATSRTRLPALHRIHARTALSA